MSELPNGLHEFLGRAGWGNAQVAPIPGDASFRRYFRVERDGRSAMLMYTPPPEEDPRPFLSVARYLNDHDMRAPEIFAADEQQGWVLLEDFGEHRMREWLDDYPGHEEATYQAAIDALIELHLKPAGDFPPYDMATYHREARLFVEWYCPRMGLSVDVDEWTAAWNEVLDPLLVRQQHGVTVLRDYHAENIMLPAPSSITSGEQGLIDFQDALVGHRAYDLVSLLQDARRDVDPGLERRMLDYYAQKAGAGSEFEADYARLGAQRNAKIVGIFTRLFKRDGKPRYLDLIPRVWNLMERDLAHPALAPLADWFAANVPQEIRSNGGAPAK
ncbi:aminoglycoside phosphotransferase family protein [Altererythrobacter sp. MF3-039]|uniref:aminoglycoside phosphotransferase family protein n=1 Tax=Altererythrobacter sp. MF3-039 TaxID=3252901 RepID=UPI00390C7471